MRTFDRIMKGEPFCLYILELQENKYYVGLSSRVGWRIIEHQRGNSSSPFVKQYSPIIDWKIINLNLYNMHAVLYLETAMTIQLIKKHGVEMFMAVG